MVCWCVFVLHFISFLLICYSKNQSSGHSSVVERITKSGGLQIDPKDAKLKCQDLVVDEPESYEKCSEMIWI